MIASSKNRACKFPAHGSSANKALGGGPGFHRAHTVRMYKSSVKQWCIFVEVYVVFGKVDDTIACLCNRLIAFRATMGLLLGAIKSERLVEMS